MSFYLLNGSVSSSVHTASSELQRIKKRSSFSPNLMYHAEIFLRDWRKTTKTLASQPKVPSLYPTLHVHVVWALTTNGDVVNYGINSSTGYRSRCTAWLTCLGLQQSVPHRRVLVLGWWRSGAARSIVPALQRTHTHSHTHIHTTQSTVSRLNFCKQIRAISEDEKVTEDLHGMRETEVPKVSKNSIRVLGNLITTQLIQKITVCTFKRFLGRCWWELKSSAMSTGKELPTFREDSSSLTLNMGALHFFKTSITVHQSTRSRTA